MLEIYRYGESISTPCALVLGGFDGLHLGHCALLNAAKQTGLPIAITTILGVKGSSLFTEKERTFVFDNTGIDFVYEIPFTDDLRNMKAENFLIELFGNIRAKEVFCGEDFRYGKDARGTLPLLKTFAPVHVVETVKLGDTKVSTSLCKQYLRENNFKMLWKLLDEESGPFYDYKSYFIQGTVEHGRHVGRTYGFPTLNLSIPPEKLLPEDGVYGGFATTAKGTYKTIINIGARPTFGVEERKVEAYLKDFSGDLYGTTVRVYPTEFLRPIEKFSTEEELKNQLKKDIEKV
ncbi:MAG: hypothetical protein HDP28_00310 [Clostridia bacterium]|nr:hypothetical protein [Clostridia bacterium]